MDWNVGIGIGLQGRPQMFEGVARAREAAAQQYQAKKQQQKADKLQKTQQTFLKTLEGKNFLPIDEQRISEGLMEIEDLFEQQAESSEPDMFSITKATTNFLQMANKADEQRNRMLKIFDRPFEGLSEEDARIVMSNSDPKVIKEQLALYGSGGLGFSEETGEFFANPIKNFSGTPEFAAKFTEDLGDRMFTDSLPDEEITINNTKFRARAVNPQMRQAFIASRLSGDNLEMVRREMNMSVWRGKPKPEKGSQEEMEAMVQYVGNVFDQNIQPLRIYNRAAKGGGINITVNTGAQANKPGSFTTGTEDYNIYPDWSRRLGAPGFSFRSKAGLVVPNKVLEGAPIPTTMFDANTGERITSAGGKILSSKIISAPVYTGQPASYELQDSNGKPIPGPDGKPLKIELLPGKIVPTELLAPFAGTSLRNKFRYEKVSWASFQPNNDRNVRTTYYQTTDTENAAVQEENGKEAERLAAIVNGLNDYISKNKNFSQQEIDEFTERFESGGSVINPNTGTPKGGVGGNFRWETMSEFRTRTGKKNATAAEYQKNRKKVK